MADGVGGHIEVERKYDVAADFALPDLASLPSVAAVGDWRRWQLQAVYYDTQGRRLAREKITLRRRSGGSDDGWHLKLPASPGARREVHAPLTADLSVPAALARLVADQTAGDPLAPIARLATARTVAHLLAADGQALAEVADDLVTGFLPDQGQRAPGWRESVRWREVEVELLAGAPSLLDEADAALRAAGARPSAAGSKLARLLASA